MISKEINKIPEHEAKYIFNNSRTYGIVQWLRQTCLPDGEYPEGCVSSIYYDTRSWKYILEKINSDFIKTKIRVRWYSDIENKEPCDYSFIEAKFKSGSARNKIRKKISYSGKMLGHMDLEDSRLLEIPHLLRSKQVELKHHLFPVFEIRYKRLRYLDTYSGARICLDYDISAPRVNAYMMPRINPFFLNTAVFEMKGVQRDLPASLKPLIFLGCRKASFSKYQACYQKILQLKI